MTMYFQVLFLIIARASLINILTYNMAILLIYIIRQYMDGGAVVFPFS